ncbi:ImmA/IrrE family metallo-endopeptidase [uncultured Thiodictyon sp.]|uniref:ImmA/IrrE family metallo-endopeptidase n=1 Tax=uncultured Thiodictyon sp. TaxID=1846217 RepID=UPI003459E81E
MLEAIGQTLALDERKLGFSPNAGGDSVLGVRLREMASSGDIAGFTPGTVLQLTEAAWVIARQAAMQLSIGQDAEPRVRLPRHEPSFAYPTHDIGYRLAKKTRQILGIYDDAPIASVRMLIEDEFALPLVQQKMNQRFAGATIANGHARGIVVNETGMNANVWVRRMTLCHELGHLLWDPDDRLQRVMVDQYADIEQSDRDLRRDLPEIRANAFAVAFLAPPDAVRDIAKVGRDPIAIVEDVMTAFGISATAAKHHVRNITGLDTLSSRHPHLPNPDDSWVAMENLTLDYFPVHSTNLSRRGKFAWCVAKLFEMGKITLDTAASQLGSPAGEVTAESLARVLELRGG